MICINDNCTNLTRENVTIWSVSLVILHLRSVKPGIPDPNSLFTDVTLYRIVVGSLQYLTLTRPEISYSVNLACQHMHSPKFSDFIAVKRILRYIKGSLTQGLNFVPSSWSLTAYRCRCRLGRRSHRQAFYYRICHLYGFEFSFLVCQKAASTPWLDPPLRPNTGLWLKLRVT